MEDVIVHLDEVRKEYELYAGEGDRLRALLGIRHGGRRFVALEGMTMDFRRGEIIGLAGLNGSGKSTLARIIAGITRPTSGRCEVRGTVSMLAANVGLNDLLTGRENIYYKCMLMGLKKEEIRRMEAAIIAFADVGVYIDQPLRTYSSGMRSRLGFAISAHIEPEILIVDEALSVGDAAFAEKCMERMRRFSQDGKTIFFVTHAPWQMLHFCDKVVWLHRGQVIGCDAADRMVPSYVEFTRHWTVLDSEAREALRPTYAEYAARFDLKKQAEWHREAAIRQGQ